MHLTQNSRKDLSSHNVDITGTNKGIPITLQDYRLTVSGLYLGDNCSQNFHLGRYIVGYAVENLVLRRCVTRAIKRDLRTYT